MSRESDGNEAKGIGPVAELGRRILDGETVKPDEAPKFRYVRREDYLEALRRERDAVELAEWALDKLTIQRLVFYGHYGRLIHSQRERAQKPRRKSSTSQLRRLAFDCLVHEDPYIDTSRVLDWLDGLCRTYEEEGIELSLVEDRKSVRIRDLDTGKTTTVAYDQLSTSLSRAKQRVDSGT